MAQTSSADDGGEKPGRVDSASAIDRPDSVASAPSRPQRPPRPLMSDTTPAPVRRPPVPTGVINVSRWLWIASFLLGLMVAAFAFLSRGRLTARLFDRIMELDPSRSEETIRRVAELVFWGSLIALIAVVVIEAIIVRVMLRRNGGARLALLVVLVVHIGIAVLADDVVGVDGEGIVFRILLVVQLVSAGVGLVSSFLPGSRAWFRDK